jgi:hypothetical protein
VVNPDASRCFAGRLTHKDVREHLAPLLGIIPANFAKTHRYRIMPKGLRTAVFYTGLYNRSLRTGLTVISPRA